MRDCSTSLCDACRTTLSSDSPACDVAPRHIRRPRFKPRGPLLQIGQVEITVLGTQEARAASHVGIANQRVGGHILVGGSQLMAATAEPMDGY